jgi:hypothetical protein
LITFAIRWDALEWVKPRSLVDLPVVICQLARIKDCVEWTVSDETAKVPVMVHSIKVSAGESFRQRL